MSKRLFTAVVVSVLILGASPRLGAQGYPNRPINLVLPAAPGDSTDVAGRVIAEELAKLVKVSIVPMNKPGAGGTIGTDTVAKTKNDGYTLVMANNAALIFSRIMNPETAPYDPLKDLSPLGLVTRAPIVLAVRSDAPYKTLRELVEYSKANPGKIRVGTFGAGSVGHFNLEIINSLSGAGLTMVPFRGASPAVTNLLGGHVEGVAVAIGVVASHVKAGSMRPLVTSSKFPGFDAPTLTELGFRQNLLGVWWGFFGPAALPAEVTGMLVPAIEKVAKDPAITSKLTAAGIAPDYKSPERLVAEMQEEHRVVEEIAKKAGLIK